MAESLVQVTEGAGKKLHTWSRTVGANTVEDEVVVPGEPYQASYIVWAIDVSVATLNDHIIQIMAGASLNVYIDRIIVYQRALAGAIARFDWGIYRLSSAGTGGSSRTPNPLDTTDAASGATAMTLPTAKGTEGTVMEAGSGMLQAALPTGIPRNVILDLNYGETRGKALRIPAGAANGIAIKNLAAVASAAVAVTVRFRESAY